MNLLAHIVFFIHSFIHSLIHSRYHRIFGILFLSKPTYPLIYSDAVNHWSLFRLDRYVIIYSFAGTREVFWKLVCAGIGNHRRRGNSSQLFRLTDAATPPAVIVPRVVVIIVGGASKKVSSNVYFVHRLRDRAFCVCAFTFSVSADKRRVRFVKVEWCGSTSISSCVLYWINLISGLITPNSCDYRVRE